MIGRNSYFDFIRGIAILMVIGIHTFSASRVEFDHFDFSVLVRQALDVAVPLFIALSAFFLYRKTLTDKLAVINFWKKQIPKTYIPMVVWSLPLFILGLKSGDNVYGSIIRLFFGGYTVYYFVTVIVQFYLFLPVLQKINISRWGWMSLLTSCLCICLATYLTIIKGYNLPLFVYAGPFILWIAFYYLGCFLSFNDRDYSVLFPIVCALLGLILSYVESHYLVVNYGQGYGNKLSTFFYSFGVILIFFSNRIESLYRNSFFGSIVEWFGRNSFIIYLTHYYYVLILRRMEAIGILDYWIVRWMIIVLISSITVSFPEKS